MSECRKMIGIENYHLTGITVKNLSRGQELWCGIHLLSQLLGQLKQEDHLAPGIGDQPEYHSEILSQGEKSATVTTIQFNYLNWLLDTRFYSIKQAMCAKGQSRGVLFYRQRIVGESRNNKQQQEQKSLHTYQYPTLNIFSKYCKHIPIKTVINKYIRHPKLLSLQN